MMSQDDFYFLIGNFENDQTMQNAVFAESNGLWTFYISAF